MATTSNSTTSAHRTFADTSTVTLFVSPHGNVFHIHEHLLFDASPFFRAAFNSKFQEAADRSMNLPEDNVVSWEQIVRWLYLDECGTGFYILPEKPDDADLVRIATTYTLAEKYDMVKLKNKICLELCALLGISSPPSTTFATIIYNNTPPNAPLRKLLVDWYVWYSVLSWDEYIVTRELLRDLPELARDFAFAYEFRVATDYKRENPLPAGGLAKYIEVMK